MTPFTDSPRGSALQPARESPLHISQSPKSTLTTEPRTFDTLSALTASAIPSPYRTARNEPGTDKPISASSPASLRTSPEDPDGRPPTASSHQHVSFESDRVQAASTPSHSPRANVRIHPLLSQTSGGIDSAMNRLKRTSDPTRPPSIVRSGGISGSPMKPGHASPPLSSPPHSRAASPRRFGWSPFHRPREDAFIPIDPFQLRTRLRRFSVHSSDIEHNLSFDTTCQENSLCCVTPLRRGRQDRFVTFLRDARYFTLDILPRQIYLLILLRLPSLYFSRIARVYEDAQLSKPDLECMIESYSSSRQQQQREILVASSPIPPGVHYNIGPVLPFPDDWTSANVSPALFRFKQSWEAFIDSLLREWKTLNLVSALLHSAIISMFQIQVMANDPVIRTAALLSLTSALMSLSYGCIYIIRFGTMRSMFKATRWAEEAARTTTFILWNVWVMLAMPAVWLAWSMIFFIVAILAYVWRYGDSANPSSPTLLSPTAELGPRIAISTLFFLGLLYLAAIIKTLHSYGRTAADRTAANRTTANGPSDGERGGGATRERDERESTGRATRGRAKTRAGRQDATGEPGGGLSAVMGLGLMGLQDVTSSPEGSKEKDVLQEVAVA